MIFKLFDRYENKKCLEVLADYGLDTGGENWWVQFPKRALEEIYVMHENTNANLVRDRYRLVWDEWIETNFGSNFLISVVASENHPHVIPDAFVRQPSINPNSKIHTNPDSSLCLMHPSEYNSNISILEIRNLASAWCFCYEVYQHTGKWPAAEHEHQTLNVGV